MMVNLAGLGCPLNEPMTSNHINDLINCTVIEGAIILLQHAFTNFTDFDGSDP
jgi:hypothetical protein